MKKRGISIMGIIVLIGVIALIAWGLNYIITKDFIVVRTPTTVVPNMKIGNPKVPIVVQNTPSIPTSTPSQTKPVATSTPKITPPTKPINTSSGLTVTYTDKGFSPSSLTVKKGQTVTFVNNSSSKLWVAANPFPTSTEYPTFNEKTGVANGSSWSYTFDKTGTWFYHNHYNPPMGAKIVVNAI